MLTLGRLYATWGNTYISVTQRYSVLGMCTKTYCPVPRQSNVTEKGLLLWLSDVWVKQLAFPAPL